MHTWWFRESDKCPWLKPPSTYSPMKARHREEEMRWPRLPERGSHGEAETAYDKYGNVTRCGVADTYEEA